MVSQVKDKHHALTTDDILGQGRHWVLQLKRTSYIDINRDLVNNQACRLSHYTYDVFVKFTILNDFLN